MYGQKITQLRKERNITQEELAQLVGVSKETVTYWESGFILPDKKQIKTLASVFQVTPEELFPENTSTQGVPHMPSMSNRSNVTPNPVAARAVTVFIVLIAISVISTIFTVFVNIEEEMQNVENHQGIIRTSEKGEEAHERVICEFEDGTKEVEFTYYDGNLEIISIDGDGSLLDSIKIEEPANLVVIMNRVEFAAIAKGGSCHHEGDLYS